MFPGEGFPVCPLSDYLRDQVNIASTVNGEKAFGREGKKANMSVPSINFNAG